MSDETAVPAVPASRSAGLPELPPEPLPEPLPGSLPYRDAGLPIEERAHDLLERMTLDEKLAQLGALWSFEIFDGRGLDPERARERLAVGIGQVARVAGATNLPPEQVAVFGDQIQRFLVEETRLGIPAILHEESLHGVMAAGAPCFQQSIGQAASWDPGLVEALAGLIAERLRLLGASQALAPVLDITRDPRWGRLEETYGEDPYLAAVLGCAYVRGIQSTPAGERPILATAKHMVGHGVPEGGLNQAPAHLGPRERDDVFLFPFEAAVREAGIGSVMHAYDDLDGLPCAASRELLTTILRERWGFDGIVVADYLGIEHLVTLHELTDDLSDAAAMTLAAGLDMELPATAGYGAPLRAAIEDGRVDPAPAGPRGRPRAACQAPPGPLRTALRRSSGRLRPSPAGGGRGAGGRATVPRAAPERRHPAPARRPALHRGHRAQRGQRPGPGGRLRAHRAHRDAPREPRPRWRGRRVGSPGPAAGGRTGLLAHSAGGHPRAGRPRDGGPLRAGLRPPRRRRSRYRRGRRTAASGADVAILVVGERSGLTAECTCGETRDRCELGLPGRQSELVRAVAATGTPIVLVLVVRATAGHPR